ncbi:MAG: MarC family protein [Candidatus Omnitrophica bacterium]|nr:MarC family protein [Candidatus Omnitrophota bacterium]
MHDVFLAFIPMFFAMDPVGVLPLFVSLTQGIDSQTKRKIIIQSLVTAAAVATGFIFLGRLIFKFLGITMGDFMVAGGAILFCLSMLELTRSSKSHAEKSDEVGAVPIGTPLIVGPAVLTMSLVLLSQHGIVPTLAAVFLNIALVGVLFTFADFFVGLIGPSGSRALSKVLSLLLAAIGVMMVRRGIIETITAFQT